MVRVAQRSDTHHYQILVDDTVVGTVYMTAPNQLSLIEIDTEYRGNGYGPAAFRAVIDDVLETNDIYISTPVDDAIKHVLDDYPHRRTRDDAIVVKQPR